MIVEGSLPVNNTDASIKSAKYSFILSDGTEFLPANFGTMLLSQYSHLRDYDVIKLINYMIVGVGEDK